MADSLIRRTSNNTKFLLNSIRTPSKRRLDVLVNNIERQSEGFGFCL
jgi:hypothetical protein